MSFDLIFNIVDEPYNREASFDELCRVDENEDEIRKKVIEAHQTLMALSEDNRIEFQDLVFALKADR